MTLSVAIVYHSGYGHTAKQAEAVAAGAAKQAETNVHLIKVEELVDPESDKWATLDAADAIIFGAPTYMGTASAPFMTFKDATSKRWMQQRWANKIASGFTNSGSQSGDKLNTLMTFNILAMQQGMIWVGLGHMPGNNSSAGSPNDMNRLGFSIGAAAQSNVDQGADVVPPAADLQTAEYLGARVAAITAQFKRGL